MIKHIVMFKLAENANGMNKEENLKLAVQKAEALIPVIDCMESMEVVTNSQEAAATNYDLALICTFASMDKLEEYQNHPAHLEFGKFIVSVREARACIDYEV